MSKPPKKSASVIDTTIAAPSESAADASAASSAPEVSAIPFVKRKARTTGYVAGVTIFISEADKGGFGFFDNGLRQNVLLMYMLFKNSRNCAKVYLCNEGPGEGQQIDTRLGGEKIRIVRTREVVDQLDYLIVLGAAVPVEVMRDLRARGCKVINYKGGNGAVLTMESIIATPSKNIEEQYGDFGCYDQVWVTPQHTHTYGPWCKTMYQCDVYEIPQVWSPLFAQAMEPHVMAEFGYKPGPKEWRFGVMDPNITVMKTLHMPVLVADATFRKVPDKIKHVYVLNANAFMENKHVQLFCHATRLQKAGKLSIEARYISWYFLGHFCDAIITHHWENGLNYLFWDVMYGGYPLIHNSEFLRDGGVGYYYNSWDAEDGARTIQRVMAEHDENLENYKAAVKKYLWTMDPSNPRQIKLHENIMMGRSPELKL